MSKKVHIISKVRSGDMDTQQIQARTHQHVYSQKLTETPENRLTKKSLQRIKTGSKPEDNFLDVMY